MSLTIRGPKGQRGSARDFDAMMAQYALKTFEKIVIDAQCEIFKRLYIGIALRNPVLTSRSRWNWLPSVDMPIFEPLPPEETAGLGKEDTGAPLTSDEQQRVNGFLQELRQMPVGQIAFLSNRLPYIRMLEDGSSLKAPQGMVAITVHEVLEEVRSNGVKIDVVR